MPNHVTNTIEIHVWDRSRESHIQEIKEWLKGDEDIFDFGAVIPPPDNMFTDNLSAKDREECEAKGIPNWYDWRCDNWGTKWNAYEAYIEDEGPDYIKYTFDTAWAPPLPVIEKLREILEVKYGDKGDVFVNGMWVEEGYQSAGVF